MSEDTANEQEKLGKVKADLFKGVHFCLCDDVENAETVKKLLVEGGGKLVNYLSDIATHLIADNADHPDVNEAVEIYEKPVVTSLWVWLSAKAKCLLPTSAFNPQKNRLFSNLVVSTSSVCKEDLEALWAMITFYGGQFQVHLDSKVTHLISTKPEGVKYEKCCEISQIAIVTPDWVVDSIKFKKKCDEERYHPKFLVTSNYSAAKSDVSSIIVSQNPESPKFCVNSSTLDMQTSLTMPSVSATQVTLKSVSLPPSTLITTVPVTGSTQGAGQPARIKVLVPSQSSDINMATTSQNLQPRQVYLTLQQQPQIRQQHVNLIQIRQQAQPRIPTSEGKQTPVKPIILQQRVQPPIHVQQPQQAQAFIVQNQPLNEDGKDQQITSLPCANVQQHSMQQQSQSQIIQSPTQTHQMPTHLQDPNRQQQQIPMRQITPTSKPQQFHQMQTANLYKIRPQAAYQVRHNVQSLGNIPQGFSNQSQPINDIGQQQQQSQSQMRMVPNQGQQMMQIHRQMPPMQQQRPIHLQQQVGGTGQSMMRVPHLFNVKETNSEHIPQQTQFQQEHISQNQMMQDMHPQQTSIRMITGQQMVQMREQSSHHLINVSQQQNGPNVRNIPPQQIVFQNQNSHNPVGPPQRVPIHEMHPVMSGQPQPVYNQQVRTNPSQVANTQVPRVPQLRIQPNYQMPRSQYRTQFRGVVPNQQMINAQPQRQFMKPPNVLTSQGTRQQMQYPQQFHLQTPSGMPVTHSGQQSQQLVQQLTPDGQPLQSANHDQVQNSSSVHPSAGPLHQSSPGVHMEVHAMGTNETKIICGQPGNNNWNQQWNSSPNSQNIIPSQIPVVQSPQQIFINQQNGVSLHQKASQFPPTDTPIRKAVPSGNLPPGRISSVGRCFPPSPQVGDQVRPLAPVISSSNVRLPNSCTNKQSSNASSSPSDSVSPTLVSTSSSSIVFSTSVTSAVVTPKTKTTLANFLNTRLQNNASVGSKPSNQSNEGSNSSQTSLSSQSQSGDGSCYTTSVKNSSTSLSYVHNKSGFFGSHGVIIANGEYINNRSIGEQPLVQQELLYGHEPKTLVPSELCLVGCVFYFVNHEKSQWLVDSERKELCKKIILKYGGKFEENYSQTCTHVICETQEHSLVRQALKEGKRCVTIYWINDVIMEGRLHPPHKIWHLPKAFDTNFRPCRDHIITTTNFEGRDRVLLKELIQQTGAKYTSYLSHKNTILICKRPEGSKFKKAIEWDMPVLNVLWLQDILFGHHIPALNALNKLLRYTKFDLRDSCDIDYNLVRQWMAPWRAPIKVPENLTDLIAEKREDEKKSIIDDKASIQEPMEIEKEDKIDQCIPSISTSTPTSTPTPSLTPTPRPIFDDSKINDVHEPMDETQANGGIKESESLSHEPAIKKIRTSPEISQNSCLLDNSMDIVPPPNQAPQLTPTPFATSNPENVSIKVMFSAFSDLTELLKMTSQLGITVLNDPTKCTHLIINRIARTIKFMCAFSHVNFILHPNWLVNCVKKGQLIDETPYILKDSKMEATFDFDLKKSLEKRKNRGTPLFQNYVFFITKSCVPSFKILKEIAESAGAKGVTKTIPSIRQLRQLQKKSDLKFVVITKEEDLPICDIFFERNIPVLNSEFILHNILRQEINFEPYVFTK